MKILGVLMVVAGIALGLYVGGYLMFICGIIQVVEAVRAESLDGVGLAWGIARVMLCGLAGHASAMLLGFPGIALIAGGSKG